MAQVGVRIDARNYQVNRLLDQSQQTEGDTITGCAIRRQGRSAIRQLGFLDPQRSVQGLTCPEALQLWSGASTLTFPSGCIAWTSAIKPGA